ncbi:DUF1330 domain-containing protein [Parasphingopyxis lamellibrachiae]|uniref:Uncharacterized protein (DUF1330 family) n=1 Tax=Parasphingopyxis lamellibrachiae TaxID=680125 RepID=A0A3D9FIY6_9SPHN|nr:DUF1330 domain-containing protein [Parasphingopyxis lamellibrachiae]RED17764.1 uncharacterized protein (DUF1330 family) [Parasphingopyxis lamellibrachiae]
MDVKNEVVPNDPEQIGKLMEPGPDGPIFMVNLLKFKDRAEYADGRETDLTGREAYAIYGRAVAEILPRFGGKPVFVGDVTFLSLGQVEELWDEVAIASYPARADMVRMSMSPEWQEISVHRTAGLKGQLNIETVAPPGLEGSDWNPGR